MGTHESPRPTSQQSRLVLIGDGFVGIMAVLDYSPHPNWCEESDHLVTSQQGQGTLVTVRDYEKFSVHVGLLLDLHHPHRSLEALNKYDILVLFLPRMDDIPSS